MSWIDIAEGMGGAAAVAAVGGPVAWRVAKPWLREVLRNTQATKENTAQLQDDAKTLKENGGSSLKDKANVAAESSLRSEELLHRVAANQQRIVETQDKLVNQLNDHLISAAKQSAVIEYQIAELRAGRGMALPVVTVQQQLPPGAKVVLPD